MSLKIFGNITNFLLNANRFQKNILQIIIYQYIQLYKY